MAGYEGLIERFAAKVFGTDPHPPGAEKLSGQEKYRIRQGDYRVLCLIDDSSESVTVVTVGHRRDVYR